MEQLSSQEGDINPIPLNTSYGSGGGNGGVHVHVHGHHTHGHGHQILQHHHPSHNHNNNNNNIIIPSSSSSSPPQTATQIITPPPASNGLVQAMPISASTPSLGKNDDDNHHHHHRQQNHHNVVTFKKMIKYKECLKNHAASMGGNAMDGCVEFMPSGEEGTIEALTCSACNCHRNFHRKELEGDHYQRNDLTTCYPHQHNMMMNPRIGASTKIFVGHPQNALGYHNHHHQFASSRAVKAQPRQMIIMSNYESDHDLIEDQAAGNNMMRAQHHHHHQIAKKRHRTKFTQEQKEKMLVFAERVGWKIQKQEEAVVQHFCQEIGVKRRVLKVWMHNNKHNLAKKNVVNQQ